MEEKTKKDILKILKDKKSRVEISDIEKILIEKYNIQKKSDWDHDFENEITHFLKVLKGEDLILEEVEENRLFAVYGSNKNNYYYQLTGKGYKEFIPWYKKAWNFINDDLTKLLSLVALILSIIATYISLSK